MRVSAWQMLASHTVGYAFQQAASPGIKHHDVSLATDQLAGATDDFPNVARLAPLLECCEFVTEFAFGLDIIIDGLEARLT